MRISSRNHRFAISPSALVAALVLWAAIPASAAWWHEVFLGWEVANHTLYGDSLGQASPETIDVNRVRIQEKVGPIWVTRKELYASPVPTHNSSVFVLYTCAGHGTDLWRTQGYQKRSTGGTSTAYYPGSAGVSLSCP